MPFDVDPKDEVEVDRLRTMRIAGLRALWRAKFKSDPPQAFGPDLLRRSIAYRIQEAAYGGLDAATARLLKQLMAQYARMPGKIVFPRRIKPGAILGAGVEGREPSGHRPGGWLRLPGQSL
jgi:hypothetical protein